MGKINRYSQTSMYIFGIMGLVGLDVLALFVLLAPNRPIGNLIYITFVPLLAGLIGLLLSFLVFDITKPKS